MITHAVAAWFARIGKTLAGAAAVLISLLYIHKTGKRNAARDAVEEERNRINHETKRQVQRKREQAHEIDSSFADIERDDLRGRMRDAATDSDNR
jgi:hypothetical protein